MFGQTLNLITYEEQSRYNYLRHDAGKAAKVFCPNCCYSFNGVLDDSCGQADCAEAAYDLIFDRKYPLLNLLVLLLEIDYES